MPTQNQPTYHHGTGRRKASVAQTRLYPGEGNVVVNGKPWEEHFQWEPWRQEILAPLRVTETLGKFDVVAKIHGGGVHSQAGALRHGIARALVATSEELYKPQLRKNGFLTRDARVKERKKYGLKRARRAPQYTKR